MTNNLLVLVDLQSNYEHNIPTELVQKISNLTEKFERVVNIWYANNENTPVYSILNWRYLMPGTTQILPEFRHFESFVKHTYSGSFNKQFMKYLKDKEIIDVYICGVYTDACVMATAYALFDSGYRVHVVEDCCWSSSEERHKMAIELMKYNLMSE